LGFSFWASLFIGPLGKDGSGSHPQ